MWETIVGKLLGGFGEEVAGYYRDKQRLKHERELEQLRGKIAYEKAKSERAERSEGRDHEWEQLSIQNSGWKDEWVLVILSIPLVLVFIPFTQDTILQGFAALETTPEWFRWLIMLIYTAVFGIRLWRRKP
jgi:hypothetical protein